MSELNWFSEQINKRKLEDEEVMARAYADMAGIVMGSRAGAMLNDSLEQARSAMDLILKFFGIRLKEFPEEIKDLDRELDHLLHPFGIMKRIVKLTDGWYDNAVGPMLGFFEDGSPVALIPGAARGYVFRDAVTGRDTVVTKANAKNLREEAICFYKPFPLKELNAADVIRFILESFSFNDIIYMVIATAIGTAVGIFTPRITFWLYSDSLIKSGDYVSLLSAGVFLATVSISTMIINSLKSLIMARIQRKTLFSVEAAAMMRVISLPSGFFKEYSSGEISERMNYISSLGGTICSMLVSTGLTSVFSLAYLTQIFRFAPEMVVPSLIIIIINVGFSVISSFIQLGISRERMETGARENGMTYSLISGIQKIKLAGAERRAFGKWSKSYSDMARLTYDPPLIIKLNPVISAAIGTIGTVVIYFLTLRQGLSIAEYSAFNSAYGMLYGALSAFFGIALEIAGIQPYLKMVEPIFSTVPEISGDKTLIKKLNGNIELFHVSFRYEEDSPNILNDVSLKIKAGQYVAIVGKTGCGKSTLLRLLIGFEKPGKGSIYYDGRDMKSIDLQSLRRNIGTVLQGGKLLNGSIYENICISEPMLTMEGAWEAAKMAGIDKDIREMPMGMQTMISEGSGGVSGGQKQRLMIARAVAAKPKILMFDEATSALDNKTQMEVTRALEGLKCTRIVIAHRLSTIKNADRILVLNDGGFIEDGTYEELIAKKGYFAELVERQRLDN